MMSKRSDAGGGEGSGGNVRMGEGRSERKRKGQEGTFSGRGKISLPFYLIRSI